MSQATTKTKLSNGLKDVGAEINQELYNTDVSAFEDQYTFQKTGDVGVSLDTVVLESGGVINLIDRLTLVDLENAIRSQD